MRISVSWKQIRPKAGELAALRRDNWDDYTFRTLHWAFLRVGERVIELGAVKVLRAGMGDDEELAGYVGLPDEFEQLGQEFCSLGQSSSYYETLLKADAEVPGLARIYLEAMRDVAAFPGIGEEFAQERGFRTSLLRDKAAVEALEIGRSLLVDDAPTPQLSAVGRLSFDYVPPNSTTGFSFDFGRTEKLPTRVFAVTGYNGVGKTRLLANLGMLASFDDRQRADAEEQAKYGAFLGEPPSINAVICVSYSAFDDFPLPQHRASAPDPQSAQDDSPGLSYAYCGLRRLQGDTIGLDLKGIGEIRQEFVEARSRAIERVREDELVEILIPVLREPSFSMGREIPHIVEGTEAEWDETVGQLSTGHKIVLNILVQLCSRLERRSLVLLDEPEMHLHPPLVAALLSSIQVALDLYDSFAIVATHSPVVAQEIPGQNVKVLRRAQSVSSVEEPEIETFGEHVGVLTNRIFHLDNSASDFRSWLRKLAAEMTLDEIEELFVLGLSGQARVIVGSELRRRGRAL